MIDSNDIGPAKGGRARGRETCLTCGDDLDDDGRCGFCERFEAVMNE